MQAIVTKYIGPTDTKGARIKATCDVGSLTIGYTYTSETGAHRIALEQLLSKLGWLTESVGAGALGDWVCGALPGQNGYAWVFVPESK